MLETNLEAPAAPAATVAAVDVSGTAADSGSLAPVPAADADSLAPVPAADAVGTEFLAAFDDAQRLEAPTSPAREVPRRDALATVPNASADESALVLAASSGVPPPSAGVSEAAVVGAVLPESGESGAPSYLISEQAVTTAFWRRRRPLLGGGDDRACRV